MARKPFGKKPPKGPVSGPTAAPSGIAMHEGGAPAGPARKPKAPRTGMGSMKKRMGY